MRPHLTRRDWFALSIGLALALTSACAAQAPTPAAPIAADATKFLADVNATMLRLSIEASRTGWVQSTYITVDTEAINARMRSAADRGDRAIRERGGQIRSGDGVARGAAAAQPAQARAREGHAVESGRGRGADQARGRARGDLRPRQVVQGRGEARHLPGHREDHRGARDVARSEAAARGLGGLAHDLAADARELHAVRRAGEQGREGTGLRRHRRDVAAQVRHAGRRVHQRSRSALGAGQAALCLAARLRADEAAREVRRRRAGDRSDAGAHARQHLGAGLEQRLRVRRAGQRESRATR